MILQQKGKTDIKRRSHMEEEKIFTLAIHNPLICSPIHVGKWMTLKGL